MFCFNSSVVPLVYSNYMGDVNFRTGMENGFFCDVLLS